MAKQNCGDASDVVDVLVQFDVARNREEAGYVGVVHHGVVYHGLLPCVDKENPSKGEFDQTTHQKNAFPSRRCRKVKNSVFAESLETRRAHYAQ